MNTRLINKHHTFDIWEYKSTYLTIEPNNCINLYSEDGSIFKIHKELFGQTEFMRQILRSANGQCCSTIEIFCPCQKEELQHLIHFLYHGEICCDNYGHIIKNLIKILGFPKDMWLTWQANLSDVNSEDSKMCEDTIEVITIEDSTETNIPTEKDNEVKIEQSNVENNNENGTARKIDFFGRMRGAKKKPFNCTECEVPFLKKRSLKKHELAIHQNLFNCSHCSFTSTQKDLKTHVQTVHKKLKPFKCSHCEKSYFKKINLKVHIRNIHEKIRKECPHCEKSFMEKHFKEHIVSEHDNDDTFNCSFCKESFSEKGKLRAHIKSTHM